MLMSNIFITGCMLMLHADAGLTGEAGGETGDINWFPPITDYGHSGWMGGPGDRNLNVTAIMDCDKQCNQGYKLLYEAEYSSPTYVQVTCNSSEITYNPLLNIDEFQECMFACLNLEPDPFYFHIKTDFWMAYGDDYEVVAPYLRFLNSSITEEVDYESDMDEESSANYEDVAPLLKFINSSIRKR